MKKDKMLTALLALRAQVDELIEEVRAANDEPAKPIPTYMKLDEFCDRWSISRSTIYARIAEGLPVLGEGHDRRVKVTDGDEWMQRRTGKRAA